MKQKNISQKTNTISFEKSSGSSMNIVIRISLVLLVLIMYGRSVGFEFTLDDDLFYQKHESVQRGLSGFSEFFSYGSMYKFDGTTGVQPYRPITLLSFSIDKEIGRAHV